MIEKCLLARIRGRVQGVNFRYYTRQEALRLGVCGWVRNMSDGSVEACIVGTPQLASMQRWLRQGPSWAHVESADFIEHDPRAAFTGFEIKK